MILDKNGRLFGKINVIDLFVIIVLIVGAVGISARFLSNAARDVRQKTQFTYVVQIDDIRKYTVDALCKKGLVSDLKGKSVIGEITDVTYQPMETQSATADGKIVFAKVPEKYTAQVTITASGNESDMGYFVGDNVELSVGTTMAMTTKYVNSTGKVKSIQKGE